MKDCVASCWEGMSLWRGRIFTQTYKSSDLHMGMSDRLEKSWTFPLQPVCLIVSVEIIFVEDSALHDLHRIPFVSAKVVCPLCSKADSKLVSYRLQEQLTQRLKPGSLPVLVLYCNTEWHRKWDRAFSTSVLQAFPLSVDCIIVIF